jgi:nucleoside-diphosphate-sugar epimerase
MALAGQLRPGNAGADTTADRTRLVADALEQLPREIVEQADILIRTDSAGATHELLGFCRGGRLRLSVGFDLTEPVRQAILTLAEQAWTAALDQDDAPRDNGQVAEITHLLDLASWPEGSPVIVRRERPHPARTGARWHLGLFVAGVAGGARLTPTVVPHAVQAAGASFPRRLAADRAARGGAGRRARPGRQRTRSLPDRDVIFALGCGRLSSWGRRHPYARHCHPRAGVLVLGAWRCHSRGCCLVLWGADDPRMKELMMRVFVAGATGAIGRQLVPRLVAAGHEVHGMTRSESKRAMLHALGAAPVVADALDPDQVAAAVGRARPDVIVHQLTALAGVMRYSERAAAPTNRLRTGGTDYLLSAGQTVGVRRFVAQGVAGFGAYARTGGPVKSEEDPLDPAPAREMRETLAAIGHLEQAVLGARWTEGIVLRYGVFYGPGTSLAPGEEQFELVRRRKFPVVGDGRGVWSFIHTADAAEATVAAVEHGSRGVYNVVDDDPAPVAEWLPALAQTLGAKKPRRVPRFIGRLAAGEAGVVMMTEIRGASNAKAKRELQWRPAHPSWRHGFATTSLPATMTAGVPA